MQKYKDIWSQIIKSLELNISKSEFKTWFSQITPEKLNQDLAEIKAPNKFVATWLRDNYLNQFRAYFKKYSYNPLKIKFTFDKPSITTSKSYINTIFNQNTDSSYKFDPLKTFIDFIISKNNRFAYSSALEVANNPAKQYNPLYIFSNLSQGKTHLLNAIGFHFLRKYPFSKIKYLSINDFFSDFYLAEKNERFDEFRKSYQSLDLFLIDDIHLINNLKKPQKELIFLFNSLLASKKQVVIAGKKTPNKIEHLLSQLKSRFEGGLLSEIQTPNQKTKIRLLKQKIKEDNLIIPDDVIFFLSNSTNDLKNLFQYLTNLKTHTTLFKRKIDMSLVKSIINQKPQFNFTAYDIQKIISESFNITIPDLLSNRKIRKFSYPRQLAMYLCRNLTDLSLEKIGKLFGGRDHSTVIYSINRIEKEKKQNRKVREDINKLQNFFITSSV